MSNIFSDDWQTPNQLLQEELEAEAEDNYE
jgi:hypothetical protein